LALHRRNAKRFSAKVDSGFAAEKRSTSISGPIFRAAGWFPPGSKSV
jgi:hypothetical protein